jgi:hypothetical protein
MDEPATFEKAEARRPKATAPETPLNPELVAVTLDVANGKIVNIERVDAAGVRRELSDDERARLARGDARETLERIVEEAFEAGIDCVLGGEADASETNEDTELSRALVRSLIERSAAKRLMQREALGRAIIGTLIEQAGGLRIPPSERDAAAH